MLNNANVLIKKNPDEASQLLFLKLEDLLRYQISDNSKDRIELSSDIRFLNDFLDLEKIREVKFEYILSKEGDINVVSLPTPSIHSFPWRMPIKHNPDSENISYVHLSFKVGKNALVFQCNKLHTRKDSG